MRLRPEVKRQAEEVLGRKIPEPFEPEFYSLVEELRNSNPELASLLEGGIEFQQVKPPEEEIKGEVRKRALFRELYQRLFLRYDELTGEWVPSRPKQILVGSLLLMSPFILIWGMNALSSPKAPRTPPTQIAPKAPEGAPAQTAPQATAENSPSTTIEEPLPPSSSSPSSTSPSPIPSGSGQEVPPPPAPTATGEIPPPPQTYSSTNSYTGADNLPAPSPMALYQRPIQEVQGTVSMAAYVRTPSQGTQEGEKATTAMAMAVEAKPAQGTGLSAYRGEQVSQGQVPPVSSFAAYRAQPQPAPSQNPPSITPPQNPPPTSAGPGLFAQNMPDIFGRQDARDATGAPSGPSSPTQSPYLPGTRLNGRLAVRLIVPDGQEVPVAVETEEGATFLGKAKLSPTRRVEVSLDQAVLAGKVFALRAVVLGGDMAQGLPAQVREEAPSLVADLVRGSLRGLSDYVRARSQTATVTTTPGGNTVIQQQTPPLEMFLGAAAADLFSVPEGTKAVVRVAEVREGTPLTVMVLGVGQ